MEKNCLLCGHPLREEWNYCPNCGAPTREIDSPAVGIVGVGVPPEIASILEKSIQEASKMFKEMGIDVTFEPVALPKTQSPPARDPKKTKTKRKNANKKTRKTREKTPKIVEEPKTTILQNKDRMSVKIEMPGIESEENIELVENRESIEVKARNGDKCYFKIIRVPRGAGITWKNFRNGILELRVEK